MRTPSTGGSWSTCPPDVAEALDAAYVAELAQRPTGPDRATRSQVAAELLRQALGI